MGAVPTLRRMPRMVALTGSALVEEFVTDKFVGVQDCCHAAANGRGLHAASGFCRQEGRDRFRSGRERRSTQLSTPRAERRVVACIGPPGGFSALSARA